MFYKCKTVFKNKLKQFNKLKNDNQWMEKKLLTNFLPSADPTRERSPRDSDHRDRGADRRGGMKREDPPERVEEKMDADTAQSPSEESDDSESDSQSGQ